MIDASGIDWERTLPDLSDVADRTIKDHPGDPCTCSIEGHDPADERISDIAIGIDHQHIARPDDFESAKNGEVIAGAGAHCHSCACQRSRVMIRLEPGTAPVALQLVTEESDRDLFQSCDDLRIG